MNMSDPTVLRKKISELELENKRLKESDNVGSKGFGSSMKQSSG
jgi:hypothetical protein